ncbi:MAG: FUSC family membrane protein, partial [Gemmatimonadaceae bacterium]
MASEVATARPAYAAGVRAALATVVPLVVDRTFGTGGGAWMSLAGFNGALIDRGGPYRMRAITMSVLALASATTALIATAAAGHPLVAVPVAFVVAFGCGMMRAWPEVGPGFGVTVLVTFAIALSVPVPNTSAIFLRAGFIIIGGFWALLLAMVVWPLQPYRPVRIAVSACYRAIGDYLDAIVARSARGERPDSWELKQHLVSVRTAIEAGRTAVAVSRRGRSVETGRGERLLILHELADQLYAHIIALTDVADSLPVAGPDTPP